MLLSMVANIGHLTAPLALMPARPAGIFKAGGPVAVERESRHLPSKKIFAHPHRLAWPARQYLLPVKDVPP
ncbi:MAG: hypothetical protein U1C46_09375 [Bacteroidales bacterium]|nr:hypothetical protein [Bacteroidales bacterium]